MTRLALIVLAVALAGCSSGGRETITQICPGVLYSYSVFDSSGNYQRVEYVRFKKWYGRRCLNCGGIHDPIEDR